MGPLRRRDSFPGEHRIRTKRIMPQSGLVPEGASFSKFNGLYKIIVVFRAVEVPEPRVPSLF